jgi:hypothetical protein
LNTLKSSNKKINQNITKGNFKENLNKSQRPSPNPPPKAMRFDINSSFENNKYYFNFLKSYHKGDFDNAILFGKKILQIPDKYSKEFWYGNVLHTTNIILGKIFFIKGNFKQSEFYLLNSVNKEYIIKTKGEIYSPQLLSYGPDTTLAYDLYMAGRRESVLKYFKSLPIFWKVGVKNGYIKKSIINIKKGVKKNNYFEYDPEEISSFPFKQSSFSIPEEESIR